jgi:hypothetical protein
MIFASPEESTQLQQLNQKSSDQEQAPELMPEGLGEDVQIIDQTTEAPSLSQTDDQSTSALVTAALLSVDEPLSTIALPSIPITLVDDNSDQLPSESPPDANRQISYLYTLRDVAILWSVFVDNLYTLVQYDMLPVCHPSSYSSSPSLSTAQLTPQPDWVCHSLDFALTLPCLSLSRLRSLFVSHHTKSWKRSILPFEPPSLIS